MHLTDERLNEYLDNETADKAGIEAHLHACKKCAARLSDLQSLFADLDSLPDVELSANIAARFSLRPSLILQPPRWLTLTTTLQAAAALTALVAAAPFFSIMLSQMETPSFTTLLLQLQTRWTMFLNALSALAANPVEEFQLPITDYPLPIAELSALFIPLAVVSIFWVLGNGWLLRNQNR
ncbi:MAG: hypothetical protein KPEEDBHJ_03090 [Anaerolineales bacterium]|nr:hypothetical protein [Anaerolineales bacterium]